MKDKVDYILASVFLFTSIFFISSNIRAESLKETNTFGNFEYIELSDYNWEGLGNYTQITGDGNYKSYLKRADAVEGDVKTGKIGFIRLEELKKIFADCNFYSLPERYDNYKPGRTGSNYRITIKSKARSKSVDFYYRQEDSVVNNVLPACLIKIMSEIENITKRQLLSP